MKAVCLIYQTPHKIIEEKLNKDGSKTKIIEMIEVKLTKEVLEKFPEFKQHMQPRKDKNGKAMKVLQLGDLVKVPDAANPQNVMITNSYIMEAEFIFPGADCMLKEADWTKTFQKQSKIISEGRKDYDKIAFDHVRFLIEEGWEFVGIAGATYALTFDIK